MKVTNFFPFLFFCLLLYAVFTGRPGNVPFKSKPIPPQVAQCLTGKVDQRTGYKIWAPCPQATTGNIAENK
jgi:hypothetical protein